MLEIIEVGTLFIALYFCVQIASGKDYEEVKKTAYEEIKAIQQQD